MTDDTEELDAALTAFLQNPFPGRYSGDGVEMYRRLMRDALRAAEDHRESERDGQP